MLHTRFTILFILGLIFTAKTQNTPFDIQLTPINMAGVGGLQAYAFGQHEGKWLIVGGRLDGLHRRQPFASFDIAGHNSQLIVIDPISKQSWTASLSALPGGMREQLSATNMEFLQEENILYVIGGYGYSTIGGDHTTYPNLTAIDVPQTIHAIVNDLPITPYFRQIQDNKLAVTGGYLHKIYDTYYLVGGQKFIGKYNPMGPGHGPGFIQEYTNAIRKFKLEDEGIRIKVIHFPEIYDKVNLHRRDYNVAPQIMPDGKEGLTAFSGVFQETVDLPFLNCVLIDSATYHVQQNFSQYYNHYHCAHLPIYNADANEMHTIFFGGIAQYYDDNGTLTKDDNVPFVNTIARVTRKSDGSMAEYKLPVTMPELLGAGSEFIPAENVPAYQNGVIKLDELTHDTTMVGYIYGGINSSAPNIFFTNTGNESNASSQIFAVSLIKNNTSSVHDLNQQSTGTLEMQIFPNPNQGDFEIHFNIKKISTTWLAITDDAGRVLVHTTLADIKEGKNSYKQILNIQSKVIFVTLKTDIESATQKVIIR